MAQWAKITGFQAPKQHNSPRVSRATKQPQTRLRSVDYQFAKKCHAADCAHLIFQSLLALAGFNNTILNGPIRLIFTKG